MALLQFISARLPRVAVPASIHNDHLIVSWKGSVEGLRRAKQDHRQVHAFLRSACRKHRIGVGGLDAEDDMSGMTWEISLPYVLGVRLSGRLQG